MGGPIDGLVMGDHNKVPIGENGRRISLAWGRLSAATQWGTSLLSQRSNYTSRASSWALSCPLPIQRLLGYSMRYTVHDGPLRAREATDVRAGPSPLIHPRSRDGSLSDPPLWRSPGRRISSLMGVMRYLPLAGTRREPRCVEPCDIVDSTALSCALRSFREMRPEFFKICVVKIVV